MDHGSMKKSKKKFTKKKKPVKKPMGDKNYGGM